LKTIKFFAYFKINKFLKLRDEKSKILRRTSSQKNKKRKLNIKEAVKVLDEVRKVRPEYLLPSQEKDAVS